MLLSFSIPEMLPMIRAGVRQAGGENAGTERVKRQTVRHRGPRAKSLISQLAEGSVRHPGMLHLWWKSRTKSREFLGATSGFDLYELVVQWPHRDAAVQVLLGQPWGYEILEPWDFAWDDGFNDLNQFMQFFVPNPGDRFDGVLFKW